MKKKLLKNNKSISTRSNSLCMYGWVFWYKSSKCIVKLRYLKQRKSAVVARSVIDISKRQSAVHDQLRRLVLYWQSVA